MRFGHQYYQINLLYMDSEKELLKKDLDNQEKPEEIKKFIEDAELLGHEDIAELGRTKLQEILGKVDNIEKTSESQNSQIESMGGNAEEITERTKEVDQKIENVKAEIQEKITAVESEKEITETAENNSKMTQEQLGDKINLIFNNTEKLMILHDTAQAKHYEATRNAFSIEKVKKEIGSISNAENKLTDYLDKEIIIDPTNKGNFLSFKGLSSDLNFDLLRKTGMYEVIEKILQEHAFERAFNESPERVFEIKDKTENTLKGLLSDIKNFLEKQLNIPNPTEEENQKLREEMDKAQITWREAVKKELELLGLNIYIQDAVMIKNAWKKSFNNLNAEEMISLKHAGLDTISS